MCFCSQASSVLHHSPLSLQIRFRLCGCTFCSGVVCWTRLPTFFHSMSFSLFFFFLLFLNPNPQSVLVSCCPCFVSSVLLYASILLPQLASLIFRHLPLRQYLVIHMDNTEEMLSALVSDVSLLSVWPKFSKMRNYELKNTITRVNPAVHLCIQTLYTIKG